MNSQTNQPPQRKLTEQYLGVAVLVLLLLGCLMVMRPFVSALMWAAILAFTLWPIHTRLTAWLRNRHTLAAALTTLIVATLLVMPFVIIGFSVAGDVRALGRATGKWVEDGPPKPPGWLEKIPLVGQPARNYWQETTADLATLLQKLKRAADEHAAGSTNAVASTNVPALLPDAREAHPSALGESSVLRGLGKLIVSVQSWLVRVGLAVGRGVIEIALSVFLMFFMLRDGAAITNRLKAGVTRIGGGRGRYLLEVAGKTVRGVVYGILGTALVQGVMAGVGFMIAGVPGAAVLGLLTFFLSVVPMGPPLVWGPAVIWLFHEGSTGWAIFMLIWGIGVSSIDNVVKPWLISQGSNLPFILIFLGVVGGALAFGFIGVFLGPTLLAVAYRIIEEWSHVPDAAQTKTEPSTNGVPDASA